MGMSRGSRWRRIAVFARDKNEFLDAQAADRLTAHLAAYGIRIEWWSRGYRGARPAIKEFWAMVHSGDWPLASVLVKEICGGAK